MNTRLPDLLHDLASEMPTEARTPAHHTLRRARTRRAVVVAFTGATVVVAALGTLTGLRALSSSDPNVRPIVPGTDAPTPEPSSVPAPAEGVFPGLWPESDAAALAGAQAAVDDGHQPLRLDPAATAAMLSTNLFGWNDRDVQSEIVEEADAFTAVEIRNTELPADVPPIAVHMAQLGRSGPRGIWSVIVVTSPLIQGVAVDGTPNGDATMQYSVQVGSLHEGGLRFEVLGAPGAPSLAEGPMTVDGDLFEGSWVTDATNREPAVVWIHVVDANGVTLGATAMALPAADASSPVPAPTMTPSPDFTTLPPDVAVTAQRVYDGALARDFGALAELLDPNTFAYNFDDGSDPIPAWREDPSVLDLAAAILQLPAAEPREIEGYGTFYLWPYLIDSDFSALTEQERADLAFLGYSDEEIRLMIDGGYGYQGPRLGIDTDGLWRNFTTVGE